MTPIEILATILAVIILFKLSFLLINPGLAIGLAEKAMANRKTLTVIYAILAIVIGFFVLTYFTIDEFAAVLLFASVLMGLTLMSYNEVFLKSWKEISHDRSEIFRRAWLGIVIWGVIAVWTLVEIFA